MCWAMDNEVMALVNAFRTELEGCHRYLDLAGVPRGIGDRVLTLKDRIAVLVEADEEYTHKVEPELRAFKWMADSFDEFGDFQPQEAPLPPLAQRLFDIIAAIHETPKRKRR